ncbi:MAG: 2-oxoacid:acceptor oxidoreductase family protein [Bacillota bacterium]|nr:2-oxoacid:acceptor oxidoreductase family protein [Bacillota bacterium]MDW7730026.1 2-oxoacid:acceptor oxidoreductase family protein [Bacillota bacterium]
MEYSVVMSGFGGQGVLMMGELLAFCGMKAGLNVTWMPAYGVEMRGGSANCTVVLSQEAIGAPLTGIPKAVIAMSEPALKKFGPQLRDNGLLMINSSLVNETAASFNSNTETLMIPTLDLATETGNEKMANLTMLGAFLAHTSILDFNQAAAQVSSFLSFEKQKLVPHIEKALYKGKEYIESL